MQALLNYILTSAGPSLGPLARLGLFVSAFLLLGGIALVVLPKEFAEKFVEMGMIKSAGQREREVRAELRVKAGTGIALWCSALMLALLLRILGTAGLDTHFLPALVVLFLPILVCYFTGYLLFFYPRNLAQARRLDSFQSYQIPSKKNKKKQARIPGKEDIKLMPGQALAGLLITPFLYYFIMAAIGIPPDLPASNHDHALHQLGMLIAALLGYLIGLSISLGSDIRERARWLNPERKS
jgi:hypothetical protein